MFEQNACCYFTGVDSLHQDLLRPTDLTHHIQHVMHSQSKLAVNNALSGMSGGVLNDVDKMLLHSTNHTRNQINS
jgi:hypothetical protein